MINRSRDALLKKAGLERVQKLTFIEQLEALHYEYARVSVDIGEDVIRLKAARQSHPRYRPQYGYSEYLLEVYPDSFPHVPWGKTEQKEKDRATVRSYLLRGDPAFAAYVPFQIAHPDQLSATGPAFAGAGPIFCLKYFPDHCPVIQHFTRWYTAANGLFLRGESVPFRDFEVDWSEISQPERDSFVRLPFDLSLKPTDARRRFKQLYLAWCDAYGPPKMLGDKESGSGKIRGSGSFSRLIETAFTNLAALKLSRESRGRIPDTLADRDERHWRRQKRDACQLMMRLLEIWRLTIIPCSPFGLWFCGGRFRWVHNLVPWADRTAADNCQPEGGSDQVKEEDTGTATPRRHQGSQGRALQRKYRALEIRAIEARIRIPMETEKNPIGRP